jgi:FAD/FMN-containing dehydrogenase
MTQIAADRLRRTLGVITAATLKLWPKMRSTATAYVALRDLDAAIELLSALRAAGGERLNSFELLPRAAVELCCSRITGITAPLPPVGDWYVLCEFSSSADEPLDRMLEAPWNPRSAMV